MPLAPTAFCAVRVVITAGAVSQVSVLTMAAILLLTAKPTVPQQKRATTYLLFEQPGANGDALGKKETATRCLSPDTVLKSGENRVGEMENAEEHQQHQQHNEPKGQSQHEAVVKEKDDDIAEKEDEVEDSHGESELREAPAVLRESEQSEDTKGSDEMRTPHMSKHYDEERVLEKIGITPAIKRRSTALRKMGLTEEQFSKGEELMSQVPLPVKVGDKVEKITGYSHSQIRRSKAMAVLGTTEEMLDEERSKLLGALGLDTQEKPRRQRSCAELLGVPIRRHTVSANSYRRRGSEQPADSNRQLDEVLPYPRLLALYQKECQVNAELRKEIQQLRYLLELREEVDAAGFGDEVDDHEEEAEIPSWDGEEVKTECVDERREAEAARV